MADVPITAAGGRRNRSRMAATSARSGGDFPRRPQPWIDLSTGINPVALSRRRPAGGDLVAPAARDGTSRHCSPPRHAATASAIPATIVAAPGTQALIQLLPRLVPTSRVAVVGPTYAEHELCWRRHGHDVAVVPDLEAAAGADVVVVVNPDNPTGRLLPPQALRADQTALLIVDEAFIDFLPPEASLAGDLPANAVVLRSFGKTYGLAGVRLGFAIAPPRFAQRLARGARPVGRVRARPRDRPRRRSPTTPGCRRRQRASPPISEKLDALLVAAGFTILGGTTLFRLASHPEATRLVDALGRQGHPRPRLRRSADLAEVWTARRDEEGSAAWRRALQVPQKVW